MINSIDTITGSPCFGCKDPIEGSWELHEIDQDRWEVFCLDCVDVLELDEGK